MGFDIFTCDKFKIGNHFRKVDVNLNQKQRLPIKKLGLAYLFSSNWSVRFLSLVRVLYEPIKNDVLISSAFGAIASANENWVYYLSS